MPRSELFIGGLGRDIQRKDIEDVFEKYGRIIKCDVKSKDTGTSFCFIEYDDERDAEEAVKSENGRDMLGSAMTVEFAKGRRDNRFGDRGGGDRFGGGGFRGGDRRDGGGRGGFRGGRGGGGGGGGGECFKCGERGHFARECTQGGGGGGYGGRDGGRSYGGRDSGSRSYGGGGRSDRRRSRSRSPS